MNSQIIRNMNLVRGVKGLKIATYLGTDNLINDAVEYAVGKGYANKGEYVVCLMAQNEDSPDNANLLKITQI